MIYKYKRFTEQGVNGYTLYLKGTQDFTPEILGEIDGFEYAYLPELVEQDARIEATVVELTVAQKEELKTQRYSDVRKHSARYFIDKEVGDIQDIIADAMKLIEFNMMLTARLAGDLWATNPIDLATKEVYKARNKAFLDAVAVGAITLRGDFDDMDLVMQRLLARVSQTNQIVRDSYIAEMQRIGLA